VRGRDPSVASPGFEAPSNSALATEVVPMEEEAAAV